VLPLQTVLNWKWFLHLSLNKRYARGLVAHCMPKKTMKTINSNEQMKILHIFFVGSLDTQSRNIIC